MAVPSSGELKLWDTLWNQELGGSKGENSLHSASVYAGFDTPDALSDFYGWSDVELPSVSTQALSNLAYTSMTANGTVTGTGNEDPTRGFYFGTNSYYPNNTKYSVGIGGVGAFSCTFTGLSSLTRYHAVAFACNSAGEVAGSRVCACTTDYPYSVTFSCLRSVRSQTSCGRILGYWINPVTSTYNHISNHTDHVAPCQNVPTNAKGHMNFNRNGETGDHFASANGGHGCYPGRTFKAPFSSNAHIGGPFADSCTFCGNSCNQKWDFTYNTYQNNHPFSGNATYCYNSDIRLKTNISYL